MQTTFHLIEPIFQYIDIYTQIVVSLNQKVNIQLQNIDNCFHYFVYIFQQIEYNLIIKVND